MTEMLATMWYVWLVGTVLSHVTIYLLLRVLYDSHRPTTEVVGLSVDSRSDDETS